MTPKIQFNERFLKWRGDDGSKTIDDFKAYLLTLIDGGDRSEGSPGIDIPNPFEDK